MKNILKNLVVFVASPGESCEHDFSSLGKFFPLYQRYKNEPTDLLFIVIIAVVVGGAAAACNCNIKIESTIHRCDQWSCQALRSIA